MSRLIIEKEDENKKKIEKDKKKEKSSFGLALKIKISKNSLRNYDKSRIDKEKEINTILLERTYLIINKNNSILTINNQYHCDKKKGENILFCVRGKNEFFQLENIMPENMILSEENIEGLNYKLWYPTKTDENENENYYLNKNDIIRFGCVKLILKEINIKKKDYIIEKELKYDIKTLNSNKKEETINSVPNKTKEEVLTNDKNIICSICKNNDNYDSENPLLKLCDCKIYNHYKCLKEDLEKKTRKCINKANTSFNYYIKFHCYLCHITLPLVFKIKELNKKFELFVIEKPTKDEYLIFESLEYLTKYKEYQKSIHLVKLISKEKENIINIKIGRDSHRNDNDVKIEDDSISRDHAIIEYNKEKGSLLLKNKSKKSDSLVLLKDIIKINENPINFEIANTFIEAKLIKKEHFKDYKDNIIESKEEYEERINYNYNNIIPTNNHNRIVKNDDSYKTSTDNYFEYT